MRRAVAGCVAVTMIVTGCTAGRGGTAAGKTAKDTVVFADRGQVPTLDPARSDYVQTDAADRILYDTLVTYDKQGKLVGELAESFAYSADVRSIKVKLRARAKFHDGTPVTAKDVAYTLDRNTKIAGIDMLTKSYRSTTVDGDLGLTIQLKQPDTLFAGALSRIYIVNSALVQKHAGSDLGQSWLANHDAGSGPYALTSSVPGRIETQRYDGYWSFDDARPKKFVELQVDETAARRDGLVSGTIDITGVNSQDRPVVEKAGIEYQPTAGGGMDAIFFNTSYGPTANPKVRKAVRLAFDYEGSVAKIDAGDSEVANGPLPSYLPCRPDLPKSKQDLGRAKQLLAEAGLSNLRLTMTFQPAFAEQAQKATLLKSNLQQIGVTLDLQPITFPSYLTKLRDWKQVPQLMLLSENLPYPEPGIELSQVYNSKAVGTNKGAYKNPKVDALLDQAATEPDADKRCELYRTTQELIDADDVIMPLNYAKSGVYHSPGVTGVDRIAAASGVDLGYVTLKR
ncbi:ABC transporter substrate-binding protein [Kribbella sp. GL6]|uniref:ABC transporter substrate-binding protein n=1 Tax=Kribbella sp. GL6 TaxID=3419765 RepID=UPI003D01CA5B